MHKRNPGDSRSLGFLFCGELYDLYTLVLYHLLLEIATPIPHIFKPVSPAPLTEHAETGIILVLSPIRYSQSGEVVKGLGLRIIFLDDGRGRDYYIFSLQVA